MWATECAGEVAFFRSRARRFRRVAHRSVTLDDRFRAAVALMDDGDVAALERVVADDPALVRERLVEPGPWLRDVVNGALDHFFRAPYLLWFVAEDPVRRGTLPGNAPAIAATLVAAIDRCAPESRQEQLDHALRLVAWSWIARDAGVQHSLIEMLVDAGADVDGFGLYGGRFGGNADAAIYNANDAAAAQLLARGARVTLPVALALGRWDDAERLARAASPAELADAFAQCALRGNAPALRRLLALGVPPTTVGPHMQSHGTALHHAVWSRSLGAVELLVNAGADLARRDTLYGGTPLGWALHMKADATNPARRGEYRAIEHFLRARGAPE